MGLYFLATEALKYVKKIASVEFIYFYIGNRSVSQIYFLIRKTQKINDKKIKESKKMSFQRYTTYFQRVKNYRSDVINRAYRYFSNTIMLYHHSKTDFSFT